MAIKGQQQEQDKLFRRYLIWCYKTTKEDFDRIERKFTQLEVDYFLQKQLSAVFPGKGLAAGCQAKLDEFAQYIADKEKDAMSTKYADEKQKVLQPEYWYLQARLEAIRKAIKHFLGGKELKKIDDLYEQEMTNRILAAREH